MSENKNNVPQWILESTTGITEQNDEVGNIVGAYVGAFRKRGFTQEYIGSLMAKAFLLPVDEASKRLDCILSLCNDSQMEQGRKLCVYLVAQDILFNVTANPCGVVAALVKEYGKEDTFDILIEYPETLLENR